MMKSWPPASSASTNRAPHRRRPAAIRDCRDRASVSPPVQDRWRGARSIRYQLTIAKLPLAKDLDDFDFTDTPVNAGLVRDLATGTFVADQRNVVLVGGTGTGKSHLAIAIARAFAIGLEPMAPQWLTPQRHRWAVLQCRRSGQSSRDRDPQRQTGPPGRLPEPPRLPSSGKRSPGSFSGPRRSSTSLAISPSLRPVASCCST